MFSATFPRCVELLAKKALTNPIEVFCALVRLYATGVRIKTDWVKTPIPQPGEKKRTLSFLFLFFALFYYLLCVKDKANAYT